MHSESIRSRNSMHEQVLTALRNGVTIITATRRLSRSFMQEYNAVQLANGLKTWETPHILTWSGWMAELWQHFLYTGEKPLTLLGTWQEQILWERIVQDSPESNELL